MDKQQSCSRSPNGTGTICKEMRVMNAYNAIGIKSKKDRLVSVSYLIKIYSLTRYSIHAILIGILTAMTLFATGCAHHASRAGRADGTQADMPLLSWVDTELSPYIAKEMGQHPKFKGEPFFVVAMKGENISPEIDDLTRQIRDRILEALKSSPGVEIVWRPSVRPWQHHRRLDEVNCTDIREITYYIGLEIGLTPVDHALFVKVGALNLKEERWEDGFFLSWHGTPTKQEQTALQRKQTDHFLLGLRPLPFTEKQPDLLAAYLARNLSCLLKARPMEEEVILFPTPFDGRFDRSGITNDNQFFSTCISLVYHYLERFSEVKLTQTREQATVIISPEVHRIGDGLYQIWMSAREREDQVSIRGTSTDAYVSLIHHQTAISADDRPIIPETRPVPKPEPEPMPVPESEPVPYPEPQPQLPHQPYQPYQPLIASFTIVTPSASSLCSTDTPWLLGEKEVEGTDILDTDGCVAMTITAARECRLFLINLDANGELTRLFPSECREFDAQSQHLFSGETLRFPSLSGRGKQTLDLLDTPGQERVYAIAVHGEGLAEAFARHIDSLQGICRSGAVRLPGNDNGIDAITGWERELQAWKRDNAAHFDWVMRPITHRDSPAFSSSSTPQCPPTVGMFRGRVKSLNPHPGGDMKSGVYNQTLHQ